MPNELTLITCSDTNCAARIAIRSEALDGAPTAASGVYEVECPRCGLINLVYWAVPTRRFRMKLQPESGNAPDLCPDEYVQGAALARRQVERRKQQPEQEKREQAIAQAEQRRRDDEARGQRETEERSRQLELAAAAARAPSRSSDVDGGDDDRGSSRSPKDDRSNSMNPNNDAYQAAADNHANQMNPNNERKAVRGVESRQAS